MEARQRTEYFLNEQKMLNYRQDYEENALAEVLSKYSSPL